MALAGFPAHIVLKLLAGYRAQPWCHVTCAAGPLLAVYRPSAFRRHSMACKAAVELQPESSASHASVVAAGDKGNGADAPSHDRGRAATIRAWRAEQQALRRRVIIHDDVKLIIGPATGLPCALEAEGGPGSERPPNAVVNEGGGAAATPGDDSTRNGTVQGEYRRLDRLRLVGGVDISFVGPGAPALHVSSSHSGNTSACDATHVSLSGSSGKYASGNSGGGSGAGAAAASTSEAGSAQPSFACTGDQPPPADPDGTYRGETAVAGLVVIDIDTMAVVYSDIAVVQLKAPYIPGFLAFREVPALLPLLRRAASTPFAPQVRTV